MKKFVALTLALVLVLGICATAFAATMPTVSLASKYKNKKVWQGDPFTFQFKLKANDFYYTNSAYRAEFVFRVANNSTGVVYNYKDNLFTTGNYGRNTLKYNLTIPGTQTDDMPIGAYNVAYGTYYKSGSIWYPGQLFITKLTVR
jgi:hypothetical protein